MVYTWSVSPDADGLGTLPVNSMSDVLYRVVPRGCPVDIYAVISITVVVRYTDYCTCQTSKKCSVVACKQTHQCGLALGCARLAAVELPNVN
jgi:hypothetical protein